MLRWRNCCKASARFGSSWRILDRDFVAAAREVADKAPYQLLSSLSEEGQTARCYLAEGGRNGESEFLMVTYGPKETVVIDVVGTFDVTEVSRLSSFRPR